MAASNIAWVRSRVSTHDIKVDLGVGRHEPGEAASTVRQLGRNCNPCTRSKAQLRDALIQSGDDLPYAQPESQRPPAPTRRIPERAVGQIRVVVHRDTLRGQRIAVRVARAHHLDDDALQCMRECDQ